MKKILSTYGIAYSILLTIVFGLLYVYPKLELHLLLNSWHTDRAGAGYRLAGNLQRTSISECFSRRNAVSGYSLRGGVAARTPAHSARSPRDARCCHRAGYAPVSSAPGGKDPCQQLSSPGRQGAVTDAEMHGARG